MGIECMHTDCPAFDIISTISISKLCIAAILLLLMTKHKDGHLEWGDVYTDISLCKILVLKRQIHKRSYTTG
jgi:hypothetical protein